MQYVRFLRSVFVNNFALIATLCFFISTSNALSIEHEVKFFPNTSSSPVSLTHTSDSGFLTVIDSDLSVLIKADRSGATQWSFSQSVEQPERVEIEMATPLANGDTLVCASRTDGKNHFFMRPSSIFVLDATGRERARVDTETIDVKGGPVFSIFACIPWGDGFIVVANEKLPAGLPDDLGEMSGGNFRNTVLRLRADFSVMWRRPVPLRTIAIQVKNAPRITKHGDLLLPGKDELFLLDANGNTKRITPFPICRWLQSAKENLRIRFACARLEPTTASTIYEYDDSLNLIQSLPLGNTDVGVPAVCELSDGIFALLGNDGNQGPFVQLYKSDGKPLEKLRFPKLASEGEGVDCLPLADSDLLLSRFINRGKQLQTIVSWVKTK